MGQTHFRGYLAREEGKKKSLKLRKCDDCYVHAISNPVFLAWEQHLELEGTEEAKESATAKIAAQQLDFPVPISDTVFISDGVGATNMEKMKSLGITHVLNVGGPTAAMRLPDSYKSVGIKYKIIDALDEPSYPMLDEHLEECLEFINDARQNQGKCVVNCQAGCNRSGVIVAADYMLTSRANVLKTILHCRKCRGNAFLTNSGFQGQLVALARRKRLLGPEPGHRDCVVDPLLWRKVAENGGAVFR